MGVFEESRLHWWPQCGHRTSWKTKVRTCSNSCDICDLAGVKKQKVPTVRRRVRGSSRAHHPLLPCTSGCITFGYPHFWISGGSTRIHVSSYGPPGRPHSHAAGVCSQLGKSTHASQRIARFAEVLARFQQALSDSWKGRSLCSDEISAPADCSSSVWRKVSDLNTASSVLYLEEAIWINSELYGRKMAEHIHTYSQDSFMLGQGWTRQHSGMVGVNRQNHMTHRKGATKERKLPVSVLEFVRCSFYTGSHVVTWHWQSGLAIGFLNLQIMAESWTAGTV